VPKRRRELIVISTSRTSLIGGVNGGGGAWNGDNKKIDFYCPFFDIKITNYVSIYLCSSLFVYNYTCGGVCILSSVG
jgi:hypothetical protein